MSTRIGVVVRVRPILEFEKQKKLASTKLIVENNQEISVQIDEKNNKNYKFDKVLDQDSDQIKLFQEFEIPYLIQKVIDGYHSTIFTYGQTGSGKTYTMEGFEYEIQHSGKAPKAMIDIQPSNQKMGVIPRSIYTIFNLINQNQKKEQKTYKIYVSFLQIYNEKIYDLFNVDQIEKAHSGPGLKIRWTKKEQFQVEDNYVFECHNAQEVFNLYIKGISNKVMATHKLNIASSRSHCIFTIKVDSYSSAEPENIVSSKLQLVDLAGSERSAQTGTEGKNLRECIDINKSLFNLRQVIQLLADYCQQKQQSKEPPFIPYRDSKLTSILKQSFGGNSYCLMIACISPCDIFQEENISTLNYAVKAGFISNLPQKNEDPKNQLIKELKAKNKELLKELASANEHITFLSKITNENVKQFGIGLLNKKFQNTNNSQQIQMLQPIIKANNTSNQIKTINNLNMDSIELNEDPQTVNNMENTNNCQKYNNSELDHYQSDIGGEQKLMNIQSMKLTTDIRSEKTFYSTKQNQFTATQLEENNQKGIQIQNSISKLESDLCETNGSQQVIIKRLIESVNMVRDLLQSNIEMREMIDKLTKQNENIESEQYYLQQENQDFRDKIEIYQSMLSGELSAAQNENHQFDWMNQLNSDQNNNKNSSAENKQKLEMINEIHNYRKEKKQLLERIKQLEHENAQINPNYIYGEPGRTTFQVNSIPNNNIKKEQTKYIPNAFQQCANTVYLQNPQITAQNLMINQNINNNKQAFSASSKKTYYFSNMGNNNDNGEDQLQNKPRTRFARVNNITDINNSNNTNSSKKITLEQVNTSTNMISNYQVRAPTEDQFFNVNNQNYSSNLDTSLGRIDTNYNVQHCQQQQQDTSFYSDFNKTRTRQTNSCNPSNSTRRQRGISQNALRPPSSQQLNKVKIDRPNGSILKNVYGNMF